MFEVIPIDACLSQADLMSYRQAIFDSHVRFGSFCLIVGFMIPVTFDYIKKWWNERTHTK